MKNYKSKYQSDSNYKKFIKGDINYSYNVELLESSGLVRDIDFNYIIGESRLKQYLKTHNILCSTWCDFNKLENLLEYIKKSKNNISVYTPTKLSDGSFVYLIETEVTRFQKINRLKTLMNEKKCLSLSKI